MDSTQHGFIVVDAAHGNDAVAQRDSWSYPFATVSRAFSLVRDYDTVLIYPGNYSETPAVPVNIETLPGGGAPLWLLNRQGVTIEGFGLPTIALSRHGNGLTIENGTNITIQGLQFRGAGMITEPQPYAFALLLLSGVNESIQVRDCVFADSGSHGLAHLIGPRTIKDSIFENNQFVTGGNMNHPVLGRDGAAIAVGGSGNLIHGNRIERWLRGIEYESGSFPGQDAPTSQNICSHNRLVECWWQHLAIIPTHQQAVLFDQILIESNILQGWGTAPVTTFDSAEVLAHEGIYFGGGVNVQIRGNDISDMWGGAGLRMQADFSDIENALVCENRIWNVGLAGIQARGATASVVSGGVAPTVSAPGLNLTVTKVEGTVVLWLDGPEGEAVRIQRRPTLANDWADWQTVTLADLPLRVADHDAPAGAQVFYRAVMDGPQPSFAVRRCRLMKNKIGPCGGRGIWICGDYNVVHSNDVHLCDSAALWEGLYVEAGRQNIVRRNRLIDCLVLEDKGTETQTADNDVFWETKSPPVTPAAG